MTRDVWWALRIEPILQAAGYAGTVWKGRGCNMCGVNTQGPDVPHSETCEGATMWREVDAILHAAGLDTSGKREAARGELAAKMAWSLTVPDENGFYYCAKHGHEQTEPCPDCLAAKAATKPAPMGAAFMGLNPPKMGPSAEVRPAMGRPVMSPPAAGSTDPVEARFGPEAAKHCRDSKFGCKMRFGDSCTCACAKCINARSAKILGGLPTSASEEAWAKAKVDALTECLHFIEGIASSAALKDSEIDALKFAYKEHGDQRYGDDPYIIHLLEVRKILSDFGLHGSLGVATWLHDAPEDCGTLLSDIRGRFGLVVGGHVTAITGVGSNRAARNATVTQALLIWPSATPLKLADRIANVEHSVASGDEGKLSMYRKEQVAFSDALYLLSCESSAAMWFRLEKALKGGGPLP
jgi:guanosine-3',5'-bis(diphosphate) 3'-pyrophosphohydrolase